MNLPSTSYLTCIHLTTLVVEYCVSLERNAESQLYKDVKYVPAIRVKIFDYTFVLL